MAVAQITEKAPGGSLEPTTEELTAASDTSVDPMTTTLPITTTAAATQVGGRTRATLPLPFTTVKPTLVPGGGITQITLPFPTSPRYPEQPTAAGTTTESADTGPTYWETFSVSLGSTELITTDESVGGFGEIVVPTTTNGDGLFGEEPMSITEDPEVVRTESTKPDSVTHISQSISEVSVSAAAPLLNPNFESRNSSAGTNLHTMTSTLRQIISHVTTVSEKADLTTELMMVTTAFTDDAQEVTGRRDPQGMNAILELNYKILPIQSISPSR